ncbi:MAG: ComEC/Rec2 family competence protein [Candidatus Nomurabacteria bacterium]|nr:ComEC/Rec2 family competence protein [Candidatus Nomurabacteria bacterium]
MRDRIFYAICFGFIFGVLLRSFLFVNLYLAILFGIISVALILFFALISKDKWPARNATPASNASRSDSGWHSVAGGGIMISIFVLAFSFGILRFHMVDVPAPSIFESKVGQKVALSGEIIDEPSIKENNQQLTIRTVLKEVSPRTVLERSIEILLSTSLDTDYKYGDKINFSGKLERPENFVTDQGKIFDYVNYLRKDGIFYVMSYPKIEIVSRGNGNKIKGALFFAKDKFLEKMNFAITAPENLLMGGLILGEKSSFNQALRQSFVNTGTIHIVALSGYNVTIVAEWLMKLFAFLPKNFGIGIGILAVLLFIIMTGGSSTAIRAGIMATLALVARATGRNYDVARALLLAGVFMILLNPFLLVFDVSFELSFLATVAVIFLAPRIEKYFLWVPKIFQLRDIVSVTCAAYIFVFPFILYKMGNLSIVALPANVLILPFIPFTMMLGFLTGFVGLISHIVAVPFGFFSYLFLHYELGVISFFSNLPFSAFYFPDFPLWLTTIIYVYFIYRLFGRNIKSFLKNQE